MAKRKSEDKKIRPFTSINFKINYRISITGDKEIEDIWKDAFDRSIFKKGDKETFIKELIVKELDEDNFEDVLIKVGIKELSSEVFTRIIKNINQMREVENYMLPEDKKKKLYKNLQSFIYENIRGLKSDEDK